MKVGQLIPQATLRVRFTLRELKFVPRGPGCYLLTNFDGDILYVGLTDELHRRFQDHRDNKEKCGPTPLGVAFWFYFLPCPIKQLQRIERTWLNMHNESH